MAHPELWGAFHEAGFHPGHIIGRWLDTCFFGYVPPAEACKVLSLGKRRVKGGAIAYLVALFISCRLLKAAANTLLSPLHPASIADPSSIAGAGS
jgi:hypothetical protein